jgi:hypothetical protein
MSEPRRSDLASIRTLTSIGNEIDGHLSLGRFDGRVSFTGRDRVSFGVELEVVDQGFHALLHGGSRGRHDLLVVHLDGTEGHLVETLRDDTERLSEFLDSTEVSVV